MPCALSTVSPEWLATWLVWALGSLAVCHASDGARFRGPGASTQGKGRRCRQG